MKILTIALAVLALNTAQADQKPFEYYNLDGKKITKIETLKTLLNAPNKVIYRCKQVKISDRATVVYKSKRDFEAGK